ncbi:MAG: hypothetical protein ACTHU0_27265 [Kofleriaceae bacterium]
MVLVTPSQSSKEVMSPRTSSVPTYFAAIHLDGIELTTAVESYLDWIEGAGVDAKRRPGRAAQGVPAGFARSELLSGVVIPTNQGCELIARSRPGEVVIQFSHREERRPEIWWHTMVRLTAQPSSSGIRIEHATARAMPPHLRQPPVTGAPAVVVRLCTTPGARPRERDLPTGRSLHLGAADVDAFVRYVLAEGTRTHPYLVVSPIERTGGFVVDPTVLAHRLATQVNVVTLSDDAPWELERSFVALGFRREFGACFDGAVRMYQTGLTRPGDAREHYRWLPERLREGAPETTELLAGDVAQRVAWKTLPPRFFMLIEDWDRQESRARVAELLQRETEATQSQQDHANAQAAELEALRAQLRSAQEESQLWEREASQHAAELHDLRQLLELAEQERDEAKQAARVASTHLANHRIRSGELTDEQRDALMAGLAGRVESLTQALQIVQALYADRMFVLPSAWESAQESQSFRKPEKALELMLVLANEYWPVVQRGGDTEARRVFSDGVYAARESAAVESSKLARRLRTFAYNGAELVMWKHLKIGYKDSIAETWRLHFEFDATAKRIVIGHCGKHLDFK